MKRLLALLLTLLLALPSGFALAEGAPAETAEQSGVLTQETDTLIGLLNSLLDAALEKTGEAQKTIGEIKDQGVEIIEKTEETVSGKIGEIVEDVSGKAGEIMAGLPEKIQGIVNQALETGKEKAGELLSEAKEALPGIWENVKDASAEKIAAVKDFAKEKIQQLRDLILGSNPEQPANSRVYYFKDFYFGMPISEAKALGLGEPYADEENGVQQWILTLEDPKGFARILFSGLNDDAALTEIVCLFYSGADTVTEIENGIDIQTTEETVNAVYDEIESWFTGCPSIELGDALALPVYPGMTSDGETISRAILYICEDGEGYDAATHYVSTTDCGVNILQYRYVDAAALDALLAE